MRILTYQTGEGDQRLGALAVDGDHVVALTAVTANAITFLEGGQRAIDAAREYVANADPETWHALDDVTLCAPSHDRARSARR